MLVFASMAESGSGLSDVMEAAMAGAASASAMTSSAAEGFTSLSTGSPTQTSSQRAQSGAGSGAGGDEEHSCEPTGMGGATGIPQSAQRFSLAVGSKEMGG